MGGSAKSLWCAAALVAAALVAGPAAAQRCGGHAPKSFLEVAAEADAVVVGRVVHENRIYLERGRPVTFYHLDVEPTDVFAGEVEKRVLRVWMIEPDFNRYRPRDDARHPQSPPPPSHYVFALKRRTPAPGGADFEVIAGCGESLMPVENDRVVGRIIKVENWYRIDSMPLPQLKLAVGAMRAR